MEFKGKHLAFLRTERALLRVMSGVKLMDKKTEELKDMLGLNKTLDKLARKNGV